VAGCLPAGLPAWRWGLIKAHRVSLVMVGVSQGYSCENRVTPLALAA
jgi:hypothetical protein